VKPLYAVSDSVHKWVPDRLHYEPIVYSHTNTEVDMQHRERTLDTYKDSDANIVHREPTFCTY
jgi:hypothetical protein